MLITKNNLLDINLILEKSGLVSGQKVADFGCGNFGFFVFPIAKQIGKNGVIYAIDIIPAYLEEIKKKARTDNLPQIKPIRGNFEALGGSKIDSDVLDVAYLVNTLYQSEHRIEMLREVVRTIKPGGILVLVDWESETDFIFGPEKSRRLNKEALLKVGEVLGLEVREEFSPGPNHFALLFKKK